MTDNSMGRSIRQTWRALRHERLMSRPARRDRRVQREACDQGVPQPRDTVRPNSMVPERLNILAAITTTESNTLHFLPPTLCLDTLPVHNPSQFSLFTRTPTPNPAGWELQTP